MDVETAGAHLVEGGRIHAVLTLWPYGHGVETDVRDHRAVEGPHVGAVVAALDSRCHVGVLRGKAALEHVGRLDEVVVDRDENEVVSAHEPTIWRACGRARRSNGRLPRPAP